VTPLLPNLELRIASESIKSKTEKPENSEARTLNPKPLNNQVRIREAEAAELDQIEELVHEAYLEFKPVFPENIWQAWMASISHAIHSSEGLLLVAEYGSALQGVVKFYPDAGQSSQGHWPPGTAAMRILAVRPPARGRGVGTLLTRECIERARQMGLKVIYLYTGTFMTAARRLYEEQGFTRAREFDGAPGPIAYRLVLKDSALS
jgi:ribosomal protein S18 acetylase RimI-like enzyme